MWAKRLLRGGTAVGLLVFIGPLRVEMRRRAPRIGPRDVAAREPGHRHQITRSRQAAAGLWVPGSPGPGPFSLLTYPRTPGRSSVVNMLQLEPSLILP